MARSVAIDSALVDSLFAELQQCVGLSTDQRRGRLFPHFIKPGAAAISGDSIRENIRQRHPLRYARIRELVDSACVQWDDWRYAVEHWTQPARKAPQAPGPSKKPR